MKDKIDTAFILHSKNIYKQYVLFIYLILYLLNEIIDMNKAK